MTQTTNGQFLHLQSLKQDKKKKKGGNELNSCFCFRCHTLWTALCFTRGKEEVTDETFMVLAHSCQGVSQSPPLLSATSLGSPCIEQGNHEPISIRHPFIEHLLCALYMPGCGHREVNNKVLAFKELQPIKRHGQIIQICCRTTVEGYRRPRRESIV